MLTDIFSHSPPLIAAPDGGGRWPAAGRRGGRALPLPLTAGLGDRAAALRPRGRIWSA